MMSLRLVILIVALQLVATIQTEHLSTVEDLDDSSGATHLMHSYRSPNVLNKINKSVNPLPSVHLVSSRIKITFYLQSSVLCRIKICNDQHPVRS